MSDFSQVEARFYIRETREHGAQGPEGQHSGQVLLSAVSRGDQNKAWCQATPCGSMEMTVNNPAGFEQMRKWQREGYDIQIIMKPVKTLSPDDGHAFRQGTELDGKTGVSYYSSEGKCGECGHPREAHAGESSQQ